MGKTNADVHLLEEDRYMTTTRSADADLPGSLIKP